MPDLVIASLRGGLNDSDPPTELADDQCVRATNVEFIRSTLGERRRGAVAIDLSGSDLAACDRIVWTHRHLPTSDPSAAQLWALGITDGTPDTAVLAYKDTSWHTVTVADAFTLDDVSEYQVRGVTLHGKLFLAYNSAVDRLHVWDGTSLRRVGLVEPSAAPTGADSGSGSFATTRYYRVRETVQASSVTILRSEPSAVLTFAPSGSGTGITVTKPATTNSNATHWELEASLDNANFYVLATTAIGTTTATDTTAAATGYGAFDLSEDVGDYLPPHSARLLLADEDRLLVMGSWEDEDLDSSVSWTPVYNATGVGNDERITLDPVSVINLDGSEGGAITDAGRWAAGELAIGKEAHVYKLIRTGNRQRAYDAFAESKAVGVIHGSMVEGVDEVGNAALYFLDPDVGPYRFVSRGGLQYCGRDVQTFWSTVNLDATSVIARGGFYRTAKQVHWRLATGSSTVPDTGLVLQTNEMRAAEGGEARKGFSTWTGPSMAALTWCLFSDNLAAGAARSRTLVPFVGLSGGLWRTDTGEDDNGTEYTARVTTKPYTPTRLQTEHEVRSARLVAEAVTGATLTVSVIPNGQSDGTVISDSLSCTPAASETFVILAMDDLHVAQCHTMQFDIQDLGTPGARWVLARLVATLTAGQGS